MGRDRRQGGNSHEHAPTHKPPSRRRASLNPEEKLRKEKTYSSGVGKERGVPRGGVFNLTRGPRRTKQQFGSVWQREETKAS